MVDIINKAIELRENGQHVESRALLSSLLNNESYAGLAHLQIAWSLDNEGKEQDAIHHYLKSLSHDLSQIDRFDALFGLASTYRSLGQYSEALAFFEKTIFEYPNRLEVKPFYAMCLYNLGRNKEAVSLLLEVLVSTTESDEIKKYRRAISLYSRDLDRVW
ncbi:tetratricopeptide repeat protein [Vibrio europaeus]|uniref:tetratricopeptide repeat protein n=1 Tax=Vibrio europaeus TaxID=300876 RepID=UPI0039E0CF28